MLESVCARFLIVLTTLGLQACAGLPHDASPTETGSQCARSTNPADNARLAAIRQMVLDGKLHAALAQLDILKQSWLEADLVRADVSRRIDRMSDAQDIYNRLLGTCLSGRAQHGLGLIAANRGDLTASLSHLRHARQELPTDPNVRNDYGYALLLNGEANAAQFEFLTALDLMPNNAKAASNLVLLAFIKKEESKGRELASNFGLDDAATTKLSDKAANWPVPDAAVNALPIAPTSEK